MIPTVFIQMFRRCTVHTAIKRALASGNTVHLVADKDYSNGTSHFHDAGDWIDPVRQWLTKQGHSDLGEFETIGAGSVVTKNVPPHEVWGGNPAVFLRNKHENENRIH